MESNDRFQWALELLRIQPDDNIPEIGCGTGKFAGLMAERLVSGRITAIDRSASMILKAGKPAQAGKIRFMAGEFGKLNLPINHFTKAIAFNVSGFWKADAVKHLETLRSHLCKDGVFYLFHQPPSSDKTKVVAEKSRIYLEAAGFRVEKVLFGKIGPALASCIISSPSIPKALGGNQEVSV